MEEEEQQINVESMLTTPIDFVLRDVLPPVIEQIRDNKFLDPVKQNETVQKVARIANKAQQIPKKTAQAFKEGVGEVADEIWNLTGELLEF